MFPDAGAALQTELMPHPSLPTTQERHSTGKVVAVNNNDYEVHQNHLSEIMVERKRERKRTYLRDFCQTREIFFPFVFFLNPDLICVLPNI